VEERAVAVVRSGNFSSLGFTRVDDVFGSDGLIVETGTASSAGLRDGRELLSFLPVLDRLCPTSFNEVQALNGHVQADWRETVVVVPGLVGDREGDLDDFEPETFTSCLTVCLSSESLGEQSEYAVNP